MEDSKTSQIISGGSSGIVQSVRFDKKLFNSKKAKKWLSDHKYKPIKRVDITKNQRRYRIAEPLDVKTTAKTLEGGIELIFQFPNEKKGGAAGLPVDLSPPKEASGLVKQFLSYFGQYKIVKITIGRRPIPSKIQEVLNWLRKKSGGEPNVTYDKLFHLYAVVELSTGKKLKVERNETFQINGATSADISGGETETINVPLNGKSITFYDLITKPAARQGPTWWRYDAFKNNCQDMIIGMLTTFSLLTPDVRAFVKQDVTNILSPELKDLANKGTNTITDLAAGLRKLFEGGGKQVEPIEPIETNDIRIMIGGSEFKLQPVEPRKVFV